ncbi:MAG: HAD family hydrolase [bacterium]
MMTTIDLLIFDLDGTLVDTRQDLANSINHARKSYGLPTLTLPEVMQYVGDGIHTLIERTFPGVNGEKVDEAVTIFREHYRDHLLDCSRFYPGADKVMMYFREKKMAVISNKPEEFVRSILRGLQAHDDFEIILGGDSLPVLKPDPAPVLHVLHKLHVEPSKTVMIGDSPSDIIAGRRAHVVTCAVTYGFRAKALLEATQPDFLLDDLIELQDRFV